MNLLPSDTQAPRLLSTAANELPESSSPPSAKSKIRLAGDSMFSGNGRAIFVGLALGAIGICSVGYFYESRHADVEFGAMRRFVAVRTKTVNSPPTSATPRVLVRIPPESLRVTAIALGHPRLALLNGKEVAEGDSVTVQTSGVQVTLQIVRIADRSIDLTDGTQIITTQMLSGTRPANAKR